MVTAKRPVYSPNIPEKFDKSDLVQNTDDGFYTNHIFDVPEVTKSRYRKHRTDISHGLAPLKEVKPVHDKGHFRIDESAVIRWFKFTLKPPYSIAHDKLRLAIWDTSFWTFWLKFGHKGP